MSEKPKDIPAFPCDYEDFGRNCDNTGMSLRDYFAAAALQAMASGPLTPNADVIADSAYVFADAMLKARAA